MKRMAIEKTEIKRTEKVESKAQRIPYEAPKATVVSMDATERLMNCGQWSQYMCGINAAYQ